MLEQNQINLLGAYHDRSYVYAVLCNRSFEFFSFIRSITNIPLILISSIMAIMNSSTFDAESMKLYNIIINSLTALLLGLISNFKLAEKDADFKKLGQSMTKLCHQIEDDLNNNLEFITVDEIRQRVKEYDSLIETLDHAFPSFIKNKVKDLYKENRTLPSCLNCEGTTFNRPNSFQLSSELNHIEPIEEEII